MNYCNLMAKCAGYAYLDAKEAKPKYKEIGFTGHKFFENDGAQCHAIWNNDIFVFAFRGTEPDELSDLLADLNAIPRGAMTHGLVHSGFRGEVDKLWEQLVDFQKKHEGKTFYITGHSLGGAMATVATSRFEEFTAVEHLYTFGSPRVGTRSFVRNIQTKHTRVKNNNDIVTTVPLFIMGYKHHGDLLYINFYGNIRKLTFWQMVKDKWRGWRSSALDGISDHAMDAYIQHTGDADV